MKRFITLILAAFAALSVSAAGINASEPAQNETKEYDYSNFTELDVSFSYHVELTKSSRYAVSVESPDFIVPYLRVELRGNRLVLSCYELPRDVRRRLENGRYKIRAFVSMPELNMLRMSGASRLEADGQEFSSRKPFHVDLSGASLATGLVVRTREAGIGCSGASKLLLRGSFDKVNVGLSGSSNCELDFDAKEAKVGLSGASKLIQRGGITNLEVLASGAANFSQEGQLNALFCEASGAAKISLGDAPAVTAKIRLSGASQATVDVRNEISIQLSGASSLRYRANDRLRIVDQSVSRASSISSYK